MLFLRIQNMSDNNSKEMSIWDFDPSLAGSESNDGRFFAGLSDQLTEWLSYQTLCHITLQTGFDDVDYEWSDGIFARGY